MRFMQRATLWIVGVGVTGVALMLALQAQERQTSAPASVQKPAATPSAASKPAKETTAFTFKDDDQMKQFAQLWQQRQATLTKMAVLQSYFAQEQAVLADQNKQLLSSYSLDVSKNYTLDTDRKVLVEREAPPQQPAQLGQTPAAAQPQPAKSSTP